MKGNEKYLIRLLDSNDIFVIPVYQREYEWQLEHCKQLYNDLISTIKNNCPTHFFGSIVSATNPKGGRGEYVIIDGQQRITTISILLIAIYNSMKQGILISADDKLTDKIHNKYLRDEYDHTIKLIPAANSQKAYNALFSEDLSDLEQDSRITKNYQYFYTSILKREVTIDELMEAISRLVVIDILLDKDDDAQLIFESLNSTGLALSESDKVRNYVLMSLPLEMQEKYYTPYWHKIEKYTPQNTDAFLRDYLTIKLRRIPTMNKIYSEFKVYSETVDKEVLLQDMVKYAKYYDQIQSPETAEGDLKKSLTKLRKLDSSVINPYVMEILDGYQSGMFKLTEIISILHILETYLVRRIICGVPTQGLNNVFMTLHKDALRQEGNETGYVEKLKYILLSKQGSGRFPTDTEVRDNLLNRNLYHDMKDKYLLYLLECLENQDNYEVVDLQKLISEGQLSIEHIMPQTLSEKWKEELGGSETALQVHEQWLHKLANLSLTAYNSTYSNNSFVDKKNMPKGFKESHLKLNHYVANCDKWTEEELIERNNQLTTLALKIWPTFVSSFVPVHKEGNTFALDEDVDLYNRNIYSFTFAGTKYSVKTWREFLASVISLLHERDATILQELVLSSEKNPLAQSISTSEDAFSKSNFRRIAEGIYLRVHGDSSSKISLIKKFLPLFDVEPGEITITVSNPGVSTANPVNSRQKGYIYFKFWDQLLAEMDTKTDLFKNRTPNRSVWLTGKSILGGSMEYFMSIGLKRCTLGFQCNNQDKMKNKKLFDYLYSRKNEIESKIGLPIFWERGDSLKVSFLSIRNNDTQILDESAWPQITAFLVGNMVSLSEVLTPILEKY